MVRSLAPTRILPHCFQRRRVGVFAGSATVRWENKTMYCITTVFGLSI